MKKALYLLVLFPLLVLGQSQTENYTKTISYKTPTTSAITSPTPQQATTAITYYDGLGRPMQQIAHAQSASGKDIITPIEYDAYGRQVKDYLPYVSTQNNMAFIDNTTVTGALPAQYTSMYGDGVAYAERLFEASPLNRVLKQAAPGSAWALGSNHEIKFDYQTNIANEVKHYKATTVWDAGNLVYTITLVDDGSYYNPNELYKNVIKDENWTSGNNNTTEEFKDKEGRVVLKRTYNSNDPHDTYYVYDIYGNLTYVIPPLVTNASSQLNGLCYQYKYDYRNRLVEKRLPGKQWEYIVYDKLDRVVATGPALAPFTDKQNVPTYGWLITKYDAFNRPILTGWVETTFTATTRKDLQTQYNSATVMSESKTTSPTSINYVDFNYTNLALPTTGYHILTINYYDNYSTNITFTPAIGYTVGITPAPACYDNIAGNTPKGLPTVSWVRILESSTTYNANKSYTIYDLKGRAVKTFLQNYLDGYTLTESQMESITGRVNYTVTKHKRRNNDPTEIYVKDTYTYTDQDRLLTHTHQVGPTGTPELLSLNTYDELGKLIIKRVGDSNVSTSATGLQKIDYAYNIRGWLKSINNDTTNNLVLNTSENDLFAFKINYNTVENTLDNKLNPLYNGNITETYWRTSNDNTLRKYGYIYDNLNRLKYAVYQKPLATIPVTNSYNETITYDKNGNIITLKRNGEMDDDVNYLQIDDLSYSYLQDSNRLTKVNDSSNNTAGFKNGINTGDDYTYDDNGNMITDANKGITNIKYNHLNLPTEITFGGSTTKKINYLYTATGEKVKKIVQNNTIINTTDYLTGFQYLKSGANAVKLQFFPTAEGYVSNTVINGANNYKYVYNYQDHLGNNRLSWTKNTTANPPVKILEENHYYPFGLKHNSYNLDQEYFDACAVAANTMEPCFLAIANLPYKYKYNGKELQDELGLNFYDYGARNYDPAIGRWMNIDPLSEVSRRWSPYTYCYNNPIIFVDPDGMMASDPGDLYNLKGQHIGNDGVKDNSVYLVHTNSDQQLSQDQSKLLVAGTIAPGLAPGPKVEAKSIGNDELNLRASLSTLKQTEAGTANAPLDYNSWNMGDNFTEDTYKENPEAYAEHPGKNTEGGGGTAAGAYQALERFYTGTDFSPKSQDAAAVNNMTSSSFEAAKSGNGADFKSTTQGRWTSLKHFTAGAVQNLINSYRAQELKGNSNIATPVGKLVETRR